MAALTRYEYPNGDRLLGVDEQLKRLQASQAPDEQKRSQYLLAIRSKLLSLREQQQELRHDLSIVSQISREMQQPQVAQSMDRVAADLDYTRFVQAVRAMPVIEPEKQQQRGD